MIKIVCDIEKPTSCYECPLCYDYLYCCLTETRCDDDSINEDCPIVDDDNE